MWLHSMGAIKKVASCKVKPYELVERGVLDSDKDQDKQVMLEDGLRDVKSVDLSPTHIDSVEVQNYWVGGLTTDWDPPV